MGIDSNHRQRQRHSGQPTCFTRVQRPEEGPTMATDHPQRRAQTERREAPAEALIAAEEAPPRPVFVENDARFRRLGASLVRRDEKTGQARADVDLAAFSVALIALLRGVAAQRLIDPS